MKHEESKETPSMEAKSHSVKFLKKAETLADHKLGSGKKKAVAKKGAKKAARKRA